VAGLRPGLADDDHSATVDSRATTAAPARAQYDSVVADELRAAVDAPIGGNAEPFVALFDEDSEWRGITGDTCGGSTPRVDAVLTRPGCPTASEN
jgi:hypothetical protein